MSDPEETPVAVPVNKTPNPWKRPTRKQLRADIRAGLVLGIESVPDSLASGVLAGINPVAALYGCLFGMVGAATLASTTLLAVQGTGAMSLLIADTNLKQFENPTGALLMLSFITGLFMVAAGLLKAGRLLRFVPSSVMTGFITAVGFNIVVGQFGDITGYNAQGDNRIAKVINLLFNLGKVNLGALLVGVVTIVGIVLLAKTRLGSMGMVVAIIIGSALAAALHAIGFNRISVVKDIAEVPNSLPLPVLPDFAYFPYLILPAASLAFVGIIQGAAVSNGLPNPDGHKSSASQDFVAQGVGNFVSGLFQGMPVGGSMSASQILAQAGARTRWALFIAGGAMAVTVLLAAQIVNFVAMPALAGLLLTVGVETIRPRQIRSVIGTGPFQATVMAVTFVLTVLVPMQYAVLIGVGLAIVLFVAEQANQLTIKELVLTAGRRVKEEPAPAEVPPNRVVVLQPYGSIFFASAPLFESKLPVVTERTDNSVVILRLRGLESLGLTFVELLRDYAEQLQQRNSTLKIVASEDRVLMQIRSEGLHGLLGAENLYVSDEWLGSTIRQAYRDSEKMISQNAKD